MQITFHIPEFARKERNLHFDVVHITTVWVSGLILDHVIGANQTSRKKADSIMSELCHLDVKRRGTSIFVHGRLVNGCTTFHQSVTDSAWLQYRNKLYSTYMAYYCDQPW